MSVISRHVRRVTAAVITAALLCSFTGCAELGDKAKDTVVFLRDLFANSIARFPEGNNLEATAPQDTVLPPEFSLAPLPAVGLKGVVSEDVNIRSGPNEEYDHLGSIRTGTEVLILHQMLLGNSPWGLTESGWISLNYVILEDPNAAISLPLENVTGLLIIPEVSARSGPGWQYPVIATLDGYSQQHLQAKAGNWYLTSQGWVSSDDIYIEGTEVTRRATITGTEVNVRKGPGTQYSRVGVKYKGDVVTIFHQVSVNGKYWGYFGEGWISLSYAKLEKLPDSQTSQEQTNSEEPALRVGIQDRSIVGIWQDVAVNQGQSTLTSLGVWHFNHDGTFLYIGKDTNYHYSSAAGLTSGTAGIDEGTELSGLYAYDGSTLVLFCNQVKGATDDTPVPYVRLAEIVMGEGEMRIYSGNSSTTLYNGGLDTVAAKLLAQK